MQVVAPYSSPAQKATALGDASRPGGLNFKIENSKKQSIASSGHVRSSAMGKMGGEGVGAGISKPQQLLSRIGAPAIST